ncbi:hypothetical protein C0992_006350 [Termitomyces sp. T32_za158]|nr:hypothetical protein C0992_006350 [Termitomyces sp. T32_za158]
MVIPHGLARAIASAVRSAVRNEGFRDAFAQLKGCSDSPSAQRLAGHAFIHTMWTLLPRDMHRNTSYIVQIMELGVQVHQRTLSAQFYGLIERAPRARSLYSVVAVNKCPDIMRLCPAHSRNAALRSALYLFLQARQNYNTRTQDVFLALVSALLKHKEPFTATLLFDTIVQDRALLLALPSVVEQAKASGSPEYESLKKRMNHLEAENLVPDLASLTLIADHLLEVLRQPSDVPDLHYFHCIQSAVVLGSLLDRQQLPEEGKDIVISLLRAIIRSQSIDENVRRQAYRVYIDIEPKPIMVNAISYARQILMAYPTAEETTTQLELPSEESSQDTTFNPYTKILQTMENIPHHNHQSLIRPEEPLEKPLEVPTTPGHI